MDRERQKEEFSNAFIQAVSATAALTATRPSVDDDSVDWVLGRSGGRGTIRWPRLEFQLKSSASIVPGEEHISWPLTIKNYDDLRAENVAVPRILVVVLLPDDVGEWCEQSEEQLELRHCAYWVSLRGYEPTENSTTKTVHVPRNQVFDVGQLTAMMTRIGNGGLP